MIGVGGRYSEFGAAIGLYSRMTHAFGDGISAAHHTAFDYCSLHSRASIRIVMFFQSDFLDGLNDLGLLDLGGCGTATGESVISGASDFEGSAEHCDRPAIAALSNELQPQ